MNKTLVLTIAALSLFQVPSYAADPAEEPPPEAEVSNRIKHRRIARDQSTLRQNARSSRKASPKYRNT
jgi:hypothetical protein